MFSCSLSGDLSVTFKRVITVRATLTDHVDDVIAFVNLCVMLLVCLNKMSNKRQLKLTAFTNKVRKAADYSFDGFNVFKTSIDGNCMFAALAHQLDTQPDTDSTVTVQEVRKSLVAYLRNNPTLCEVDSLPEGNYPVVKFNRVSDPAPQSTDPAPLKSDPPPQTRDPQLLI